jgi:hypothetical protein
MHVHNSTVVYLVMINTFQTIYKPLWLNCYLNQRYILCIMHIHNGWLWLTFQKQSYDLNVQQPLLLNCRLNQRYGLCIMHIQRLVMIKFQK